MMTLEVPMSDQATLHTSPLSTAFDHLRRAGKAFVNGLDLLFTAHDRVRELNRLVRCTDAQLQDRGTSREAEIARILGPR
ncbi:hypothetical protein Q9295_08050 [Xinfangfangia sp. CPCC 101601]|uniref:DUF1127 domain-containing protein n=1 Tax=Pseudogemmobacter lacusdianii TaxID=3069608 RepID=A0ABU0VX23_9RHOB|nr:hypothetical protein [Xinfangfangia sp. CPCC 101601]MDQ2066321.1 hypothetical protein [Xinfangfangia sp. CPCC 101601]